MCARDFFFSSFRVRCAQLFANKLFVAVRQSQVMYTISLSISILHIAFSLSGHLLTLVSIQSNRHSASLNSTTAISIALYAYLFFLGVWHLSSIFVFQVTNYKSGFLLLRLVFAEMSDEETISKLEKRLHPICNQTVGRIDGITNTGRSHNIRCYLMAVSCCSFIFFFSFFFFFFFFY